MINDFTKKEAPVLSTLGLGGGNASRSFLSGAVVLGNRSLRFSDTSTYLNRTPSSTTNRTTWTWSGWVKRCSDSSRDSLFRASTSGSDYTLLKFRGTGGGQDYRISLDQYGGDNFYVYTNAEFRDMGAWYHVVCAVDTTQGTDTNRVKIYVNGVQQTLSTSTNLPGSSINTNMNDSSYPHYISYNSGTNVMNGLITDVHFIDGSQLTPSSFGAADSNGVWQRSTYSGSYGTNGFHILDFANEGTIGNDTSGNGNNFTANGFSAAAGSGNDVLFDFPTNDTVNTDAGAGGEVIGNYCVFNSLNKGNDVTLSNGNLQAACTSSSKDGVFGTIGVSSGKYYWEVELTSADGNTNAAIGVALGTLSPDAGSPTSAGAYFYSSYNGNKWLSSADSSYGASYTTGDIIGVALDLDNTTLTFYKNGVSQGNATTSLPSGTYFPYVGDNANNSAQTVVANWGQRAFSYSAPSNFKCLTTTSLPTPGVADGSDHFDAILYVGNETARSITGLSFSPDLVILKNRERDAYNHYWADSVRGGSKQLYSNLTEGEHAADRITSFDSNGFSIASHGGPNYSGEDYVAWCFDGGTSTVSNTNGSITSSVRASQTAGISIVSYTGNNTSGATVGHGLNAEVEFAILKTRDQNGQYWHVYHSALAADEYIYLNRVQAKTSGNDFMNGTRPTSSVFTLGNGQACNKAGDKVIGYFFNSVEGFSAFGSYTGNASADGPFVGLSFRPALVIVKCSSTSNSYTNWDINDSSRDTFNTADATLCLNLGDGEASGNIGTQKIDFLSNGFKIRQATSSSKNLSGQTYIWAAWAENPFQANGGLAR